MAFQDRWTLTRAQRLGGKITVDNSKMPGTTFALDAKQCKMGQVLSMIPGSVCAGCNMLGLQKRRSKVQKRYAENQRITEVTLSTLGPKVYGEAHAYQILHYGHAEHRWLASGDLTGPLMLDAICHVARLTPSVAHWVATREKAKVLAWHADKAHTLPDNVTIRISGAMVNGEPNKGLPAEIVTSTVHRGKNRKPRPHDCPALMQGDRCLDCRHCWDRSVKNVSYQFHNYGNTAEADMLGEVWLAMKQSRKEKEYGTDKWTLVPETMGEKIPFADMQGEFNVLTNPIFDYAFERVLEQHEPKHSLAFLSLCAASNDKSRKWRKYAKDLADVDLIVCSNAGVVPFDMWRRYYPYRSYDAPRAGGHWDDLYVEKMYERILTFFEKFKYERVIANFIPTNERCLTACHKALGELRDRGQIQSYVVLPTWDTYEAMRERLSREGRPNGTYHPDVEKEITDVLQERIANWTEL